MKCLKCDSEMVCEKTTYTMPPQYIHECKKCGNISYSKMFEFGTTTISQIIPTEIAFTCAICGDGQPCNYYSAVSFPVCDQCKKDLKEFVLSKRKNIPE